MSDFTVYAQKKAFDKIVFEDVYPNFKKILTSHATIILNITEEELEDDLANDGEIFYFIHANAGAKEPIAYQAPFENINEDRAELVSTPRSVYFLDISDYEAKKISDEYGIVVQSCEAINDNILNDSFLKELIKGEVIESGANKGWKYLLNFDLPPSNSLVISDNHLFNNTENENGVPVSVGGRNLIWLLDKLLPNSLNIDYHITVLSHPANKSQKWHDDLIESLESEIKPIRKYGIHFEVVFIKSEHLHKRRLIMNYVNGSCDKGFSVFRIEDGKTVRADNDIRMNSVFSGLGKNRGDTEFDSATTGLKIIKRESEAVAGVKVKNRLINDV